MPNAWQYAKANYIKVPLSDPVFLSVTQSTTQLVKLELRGMACGANLYACSAKSRSKAAVLQQSYIRR